MGGALEHVLNKHDHTAFLKLMSIVIVDKIAPFHIFVYTSTEFGKDALDTFRNPVTRSQPPFLHSYIQFSLS